MSQAETREGLVFVLSGPSGAGKTTLVQELKVGETDVHFCVTATTRAPRPGERDGIDYYFLSREEFEHRLSNGGFLEWARVPPPDGQFYGTPRSEVEEAITAGRDVLLQVDVQGAASVRGAVPSAITIFLRPLSPDALRTRVGLRATEGAGEMERRLANARSELEREREFDYSVVNEDGRLHDAVTRVRQIMRAERAKRGAFDEGAEDRRPLRQP